MTNLQAGISGSSLVCANRYSDIEARMLCRCAGLCFQKFPRKSIFGQSFEEDYAALHPTHPRLSCRGTSGIRVLSLKQRHSRSWALGTVCF
jgi:hypothetical protein